MWWHVLQYINLLFASQESVASDCANQSWIAVEIYPNSKICFIKTKKDGLCLKNMGYVN